jgi:hypothetical protein
MNTKLHLKRRKPRPSVSLPRATGRQTLAAGPRTRVLPSSPPPGRACGQIPIRARGGALSPPARWWRRGWLASSGDVVLAWGAGCEHGRGGPRGAAGARDGDGCRLASRSSSCGRLGGSGRGLVLLAGQRGVVWYRTRVALRLRRWVQCRCWDLLAPVTIQEKKAPLIFLVIRVDTSCEIL